MIIAITFDSGNSSCRRKESQIPLVCAYCVGHEAFLKLVDVSVYCVGHEAFLKLVDVSLSIIGR